MSSSTTTAPPNLAAGRTTHAALTGGIVFAVSLVANLVILVVGRLADAEMEVLQPGADEPTTIDIASVFFSTLFPLLLGTVVLVLAALRWGRRALSALSWVGLGLGLVTIVMPLVADVSAGTRITLVAMHLVLGVTWFTVLRRELDRVQPRWGVGSVRPSDRP